MASILKTNAIEPEGGTTNLVIGESGQNTIISNNDIRANVLQDAGGNAIFTSNGSGVLSGINSGFSSMILISSQTVSGSAALSFTSGIDSTYKEYIFKFYNVNPATDSAVFGFQGSVNGGTDYGQLITSTFFRAYHHESGFSPGVSYYDFDLAQSTNQQPLTETQGFDADESVAGELHLFNPASTTYVKHFTARIQHVHPQPVAIDAFIAGYFNTTTAINAIKFYMSSGNFDGKIKMWGVR